MAPDGYVPVASCLIGTGDYYYINVNDGPGGPLYRIYHEAVGEHGYKANEAVAVVLSNYERLLEYIEPEHPQSTRTRARALVLGKRRPRALQLLGTLPRVRQPIVHRDLGNEQSEQPREVLVFVSEQRIVKAFYLNTKHCPDKERNTGRGVPLLVVAEHAIRTTADRVAFITSLKWWGLQHCIKKQLG